MHACDGGAEPDPRHRYCYTYSTNLGRASFVCETAEFRLDRGVDTKTLVMNSLVTPSSTHNKYEMHLCKTLVCPGLAQFEDVMR